MVSLLSNCCFCNTGSVTNYEFIIFPLKPNLFGNVIQVDAIMKSLRSLSRNRIVSHVHPSFAVNGK